MAAIRTTAASRLGWPISTGLTMGSAACSSSVFTRPSQDCVLLYRAFRMVGALRWPTRPLIPIEAGLPSVKAFAGSWHVLHATVPSADRRPSKNSLWPRAIFSGACGLSVGIAPRVAPSGTPTCRRDFGRANGPASGMGGAFGVTCCVASSSAACGAGLAGLLARSQPRISVAAPTTSISGTHNCVRFATRIPQRSSLRLWITLREKKGRAHPQHRIESGLEMGFEKPEVFVEFTSDAGKEVSGNLVVQVLTGVYSFTKGIRVMRDIVNEPLQLRRAVGGRKIGFLQAAVGCGFARGSVGHASKSHDALGNCVGLFLDVRGDRIK